MAEETSINVGGTWKAIDDCKVNVGGSWKQVETISVNVGGTWKTVWNNFVVTVTGASRTKLSDPVASAGIGYEWRPGGTVYTTDTLVQASASTDWIIPNSAADTSFSIRFTEGVGTTANWAWDGDTVDGSTWHGLGSVTRQLMGGSNNGADATGQATVEISNDGGSTILDSATYTINVELLI